MAGWLLRGSIAVVAIAACGGDDESAASTSSSGTGGFAGAGGGVEPIVWAPCPLEIGGAENDAECATVDLPVHWDRPDGATIPIFVQRYLARSLPAKAQLWMLQGGPGAAGDGWAPVVQAISNVDPAIDFYIPDHRGTGRSARLGCTAEEAADGPGGTNILDTEWPACLAAVTATWGDDLEGFSSMGASRDVAALIDRTREANKPVMLHGASYGTTWGHRFLQLFPDTVDGVILDSTNWPDRSYEDYDQLWDTVAQGLFDACGSDAFCSAKLGTDPWTELGQLYVDLAAGHCPELTNIGLDRTVLSQAVGWMTAYGVLRPAALATVYRIRRCDPADQSAVVDVINALFGVGGLLSFDNPLFSAVLSRHVLNSEVGRMPVSAAAVAFAQSCTVCLGAGLQPFDRSWPRYPFDGFESWADTATPLLVLNGALDPFAPYFRLEQAGAPAHFDAPGQYVLEVPLAAHGSVFGSATISGGTPCGLSLMLDFISDPAAALDTGCLTEIAPIDFEGTEVATLFGTTDAWENP